MSSQVGSNSKHGKVCQQETKLSPRRRLEAPRASGDSSQLELHRAPGDGMPLKGNREFILMQKLIEIITPGSSMILPRISRDNFHDVLLNIAIWSQFTSDWLWDSLRLGKDHENFKRVAMNKSFPTTQALIQSVQQQVQAVVDSNISYNMKVRETLRLSSITLLNDTAATLIRLKIHVVSDSTL